MNSKRILALALGMSMGMTMPIAVSSADLNPIVTYEGDVGPELVGGGCYDIYPVTLNALSGYNSLLAIACLRFGTDTTPCVYDLYILPSGTTSWNVSLGNMLPARSLQFLSLSDIGVGMNRFAQIMILDGSVGGDSFLATRHFIIKGEAFTSDKPISNCE